MMEIGSPDNLGPEEDICEAKALFTHDPAHLASAVPKKFGLMEGLAQVRPLEHATARRFARPKAAVPPKAVTVLIDPALRIEK